eukprot:Nk52_evm11s147 gene=Nk52_evmTU11s147
MPGHSEKVLKAVKKAGGKRGVEIEGAAAMGGLSFFCTKLDEPEGDMELLELAMEAMNEEPVEGEEERRGGAGHIGKMLFSTNNDVLVAVAHVPAELNEKVKCDEWIKHVMDAFGGEVLASDANTGKGQVKADKDAGKFPLKMRDEALANAIAYLRSKDAFPEAKDESSDDECFGDDFDFDAC